MIGSEILTNFDYGIAFCQFSFCRLKQNYLHFLLCCLLGLKKIQDWIKQSLEKRLKKSLSRDWLRNSDKFRLRDFYVQLDLVRKIRRPLRSEQKSLTSIHELLEYINTVNSGGIQSAAGTSSISTVVLQGMSLYKVYNYYQTCGLEFALLMHQIKPKGLPVGKLLTSKGPNSLFDRTISCPV